MSGHGPTGAPGFDPSPLPSGAEGSGVLDAAALGRLRELDPDGKTGLVVRVLRAFDGSARRLCAQLAEARAAGDMTTISRVVHTIKSSSASIGALSLSRRCVEIETTIRNDSTQPLDLALDALIGDIEVVLKALSPMLGQTP